MAEREHQSYACNQIYTCIDENALQVTCLKHILETGISDIPNHYKVIVKPKTKDSYKANDDKGNPSFYIRLVITAFPRKHISYCKGNDNGHETDDDSVNHSAVHQLLQLRQICYWCHVFFVLVYLSGVLM